MRLPLIRSNFDHVTAIAYSTPEEQALVERRFRPNTISSVIGIGFDTDPPAGDGAKFRAAYGLGSDPYLLFLGRIDPNKAADEAVELVRTYRRARDSNLRLVLVGEPAVELPDDDGIVVTGFVDDAVRWDALDGCTALLQPSYQESFSMVLAEAWSAGVSGLVQSQCDVLAGFAERSRGALAYSGVREFVTCVDLLLDQSDLRSELGRNGQRHVQENFTWSAVMNRYESLLLASVDAFTSARAASCR
jgi:glycosyltransferase involved in cell wall biosynthesis